MSWEDLHTVDGTLLCTGYSGLYKSGESKLSTGIHRLSSDERCHEMNCLKLSSSLLPCCNGLCLQLWARTNLLLGHKITVTGQEQVQGRDRRGSRPEPEISVGTGLNQQPQLEPAQGRDLHRSRLDPMTSAGAGPRQQPPQEQVH